MLRILYDDFDQKVKNIHNERDYTILIKIKVCMAEPPQIVNL